MIDALYIFLIFLNFTFWIYLRKKNKDGVVIILNNIFFLFYMVVPGYIQYKNQAYPWLHYLFINNELLGSVLILLIIYSLFLILGYLSVNRCSSNLPLKAKNISVVNIRIFIIVVSIPSIYLITKLGVTAFFSGRDTVGEQIYSEAGSLSMLYAFAKFSIYAVLIGLVVTKNNIRANFDRNGWSVVFFLFVVILNIIVNSPLSSPRFHFLGMVLGLLLVYGYLLRPMHKIILSLVAPFFLYFVFPTIKSLGQNTEGVQSDFWSYIMTGVDYDCMVQMVNIFQYVNEGNYSFGTNILGGLAFFVPREIWPNKPVNLGMLSSEYFGLIYNNLSAPWPGELYYICGFPSLIVGAFLTGVFFAKVDLSIFSKRQDLKYGLSVIFTGFIFITLRGAFGSVFPLIFLSLFVFFVYMQIAKISQKI